jgi:hypothetical protein
MTERLCPEETLIRAAAANRAVLDLGRCEGLSLTEFAAAAKSIWTQRLKGSGWTQAEVSTLIEEEASKAGWH